MDSSYQRIPIIKLWSLLLVPLQGELTDNLANQLTSEVQSRIHEDGCSGLVIDITPRRLVAARPFHRLAAGGPRGH